MICIWNIHGNVHAFTISVHIIWIDIKTMGLAKHVCIVISKINIYIGIDTCFLFFLSFRYVSCSSWYVWHSQFENRLLLFLFFVRCCLIICVLPQNNLLCKMKVNTYVSFFFSVRVRMCFFCPYFCFFSIRRLNERMMSMGAHKIVEEGEKKWRYIKAASAILRP